MASSVQRPTPTQRRLRDLEDRVIADAGDDWVANIKAIRADLAGEADGVRERILALVAPQVEADARSAVIEAFGIGRNAALRQLVTSDSFQGSVLTIAAKTATVAPTRATSSYDGMDRKLADAVTMARRLLTAGADLDAAFAPISAATNRYVNATTWAINAGGNDAVVEVANLAEASLVWVAEFDACVDCLAYSGQECGPGDVFPGGLTFGAEARFNEDLPGPPLHGHCRCTVELVGDSSYPEALRREAERSVLRGFSLDSESMTTRLGAAERLLAKNPDVPKSVASYAAKAIKTGAFPTRGRPG